MKRSAISSPKRLRFDRQKQRTWYFLTVSRSAQLYRIRASFIKTAHPFCPARASHCTSITSVRRDAVVLSQSLETQSFCPQK